MFLRKIFCLVALVVSTDAAAATAMSDRALVEAQVRSEVQVDTSLPWEASSRVQALGDRTCLDGRPLEGLQGDLVELWVDLECPYCGVQEAWQAQRQARDMCIVVRHMPSDGGDSLKKALSYEALKQFSANAANIFWEKVIPKTGLAIPVPYEGALLAAFHEASIDPSAFSDTLMGKAQERVAADLAEGQAHITSTPTFVLEGIRFGSCDFTAKELPEALALAKKARQGDAQALDEVGKIISRGKSGEQLI